MCCEGQRLGEHSSAESRFSQRASRGRIEARRDPETAERSGGGGYAGKMDRAASPTIQRPHADNHGSPAKNENWHPRERWRIQLGDPVVRTQRRLREPALANHDEVEMDSPALRNGIMEISPIFFANKMVALCQK